MSFLTGDDTGFEAFDKVFETTTSSPNAVNALLTAELPGGETVTFMNDLLLTAKNYRRVIVTGVSITLGIRANLGDSDQINRAMQRAAYLATRLEALTGL